MSRPLTLAERERLAAMERSSTDPAWLHRQMYGEDADVPDWRRRVARGLLTAAMVASGAFIAGAVVVELAHMVRNVWQIDVAALVPWGGR